MEIGDLRFDIFPTYSRLVPILFGYSANLFNFIFSRFWAAAPKGSMTYAFTHMESFLLLLLLLLLLHAPPSPLAFRPISQPGGP